MYFYLRESTFSILLVILSRGFLYIIISYFFFVSRKKMKSHCCLSFWDFFFFYIVKYFFKLLNIFNICHYDFSSSSKIVRFNKYIIGRHGESAYVNYISLNFWAENPASIRFHGSRIFSKPRCLFLWGKVHVSPYTFSLWRKCSKKGLSSTRLNVDKFFFTSLKNYFF